MTTYPLRRAAAMVAGIALIGAETHLIISSIRDTAVVWHEQPLVVAVGMAGVAQAVAASVFVATLRQRRWALALLTFLGLAAAVAFTFSSTYERSAAAREARAQKIDVRNSPQRQAASRVASAESRAKDECEKARGPECRKREAELTEARAAYVALPREASTRLLGELDIVPELALPAMLLLLGLAFIGFADEAPRRRREPSAADSAQTSLPAFDPPPAAAFKPDADEREANGSGERLAQVESFCRAHMAKHGRLPRHRTVMDATGLPRATASRYLKKVRAATA